MTEQIESFTNTEEIQEQSLVNFMAVLGYEPVYDSLTLKLLRFKQPRFACVGQEYIGLKRAIHMHNNLPQMAWQYISTVNTDFASFVNSPGGEDMIQILAAGNARIVQTVKGKPNKKGFYVELNKGDHMVKFQTIKDYKQYRHYVGE